MARGSEKGRTGRKRFRVHSVNFTVQRLEVNIGRFLLQALFGSPQLSDLLYSTPPPLYEAGSHADEARPPAGCASTPAVFVKPNTLSRTPAL